LDYGGVVYIEIALLYLIKRLQQVQNEAAGFVAPVDDVINLSWLPAIECHEYAITFLPQSSLRYQRSFHHSSQTERRYSYVAKQQPKH